MVRVAALTITLAAACAPVDAQSPLTGRTTVFDRAVVRAALVRAGGHRTRAAEELGVSRQGLAKLMARLGIDEGVPEGR